MSSYVNKDSLMPKDIITVGTDKFSNTYTFFADAYLNFKIFGGTLNLQQTYRGTSYRSENSSFRDNQSLKLFYERPVSKNFFVNIEQSWLLNADTKFSGTNDLEILDGKIGGTYKISPVSSIELYAGKEHNNQMNIASNGNVYGTSIKLDQYRFSDFIFKISGNAENVDLSDKRKKSDYNLSAVLLGNFDAGNNMSVNFKYKGMDRDYLTNFKDSVTLTNVTENRNEKRYESNFFLNYNLTDFIKTNSLISYSNTFVDRAYKSEVDNLNNSKYLRQSNESQFSVESDALVNLNKFQSLLSLSYHQISESNDLKKRFAASDEEYNVAKDIEQQRDYNSTRTQLSDKSFYTINQIDSLLFHANIGLLRYDTPSLDNDDERDELNSSLGIGYFKTISNNLSLKLESEYQFNHLVFLKADRSAVNNKNRILTFSPQVIINYNNFYMNPKFELMANYTVYDYEKLNLGVKSFSFRQLSYRDTVYIGINTKFNLQANIIVKYFQRGILYWDSFSETPQLNSLEQSYRLMLYDNLSQRLSFGLGFRYYNINQKTLNSSIAELGTETNQTSIAPETSMIFFSNIHSQLFLSAWYEFRNLNHYSKSEVVNLSLRTIFHF